MATREIDEVTTITRKRVLYICDGCGREGVVSLETCFICGRDVCTECRRYISDDRKMWHEYEHCCCNNCWDAGKEHIAAMNLAEDNFRTIFESEISMWKDDVKKE